MCNNKLLEYWENASFYYNFQNKQKPQWPLSNNNGIPYIFHFFLGKSPKLRGKFQTLGRNETTNLNKLAKFLIKLRPGRDQLRCKLNWVPIGYLITIQTKWRDVYLISNHNLLHNTPMQMRFWSALEIQSVTRNHRVIRETGSLSMVSEFQSKHFRQICAHSASRWMGKGKGKFGREFISWPVQGQWHPAGWLHSIY